MAHDPTLFVQLAQDRLGGLRSTEERHELRNRQQHRAVGIAVAQQCVHLQNRAVGPARIRHEAVVDDPFEDRRRPDAHGRFVPERRSPEQARLAGVTEHTEQADQANDTSDDAEMARISAELVAAVDAVIGPWVQRCVLRTCTVAGITVDEQLRTAAVDAAEACRVEVVAELDRLLTVDIDDQTATPLQVLRAAVRFPTGVLSDAAVPPVTRDEFDQRAFPDDVYGLSPATFADVDASLAEPGLRWGAAKAHVHLARRRSSG